MSLLCAVAANPGWQETVIAVATGIIALGVVGAALGTYLTWSSVKESAKSRHAQIGMDMDWRWDQDYMIKVKQSLYGTTPEELQTRLKALQEANGGEYYELERFAYFFEHLGTLHRFECLEIEWIDESLGSCVMEYWELWKPTVMVDRARWPKQYENWEAIATEIARRRGLAPKRS